MGPDMSQVPQSEVSKLAGPAKKPSTEPNVREVVLGSLLTNPWYPSFYPDELVGHTVERLYVCHRCFKYSKELMAFLGHVVCGFRVFWWRRNGKANSALESLCGKIRYAAWRTHI